MTSKKFLRPAHWTNNVQAFNFAGIATSENTSLVGAYEGPLVPQGLLYQRAFCHSSTRRAGGRTNARHTDIGWRNLRGPSPLDGAAVRSGEGQPDFPVQRSGRKTSAPVRGGCGFLSFSSSFQETRAVSTFSWGGRSLSFVVLFLSFNSLSRPCFASLGSLVALSLNLFAQLKCAAQRLVLEAAFFKKVLEC